ncbi:MAG: hypothetical protein ACE5DS_04210 [Kiloniellaceae bacterium]
MYRDNTLIPSEAVRLLALGLLGTREMPYAALASEVRYFIQHVVGPSLDLVGTPLQVLKVEGLIEPVDEAAQGTAETAGDETLRITVAGRDELTRLLNSNVRPPVSDINKLIVTLKMRFLHLLEPADRRLQVEMIAEMYERQLVRLTELRAHHAAAPGCLPGWLDLEVTKTRQTLEWFQKFLAESA